MNKELQVLTMQRKLKAERLARHSQPSSEPEEKSDAEKPAVQAPRRRRRQAVVPVAVRAV